MGRSDVRPEQRQLDTSPGRVADFIAGIVSITSGLRVIDET